jgi:hypothetical protein
LPELRYRDRRGRDRRGRDRRVRYWTMRERDGQFRPNKEIDQIRWLRTDIVDELLTSARDLLVVSWLGAIDTDAVSSPGVSVRL